ncbi:putative uncharacterized protein DDB_G0271982, partial [Vombatus ursinus]|uniref:putative uncharacterized protein DDB_G0271982 n=1 Tax=Vombatus ursinus TaxID=29139 RepID=UPI000FFD8CC3
QQEREKENERIESERQREMERRKEREGERWRQKRKRGRESKGKKKIEREGDSPFLCSARPTALRWAIGPCPSCLLGRIPSTLRARLDSVAGTNLLDSF